MIQLIIHCNDYLHHNHNAHVDRQQSPERSPTTHAVIMDASCMAHFELVNDPLYCAEVLLPIVHGCLGFLRKKAICASIYFA